MPVLPGCPWVVALALLSVGCAGRYDRARVNHYDGAAAPVAARKLVVVVNARNGYGASGEQIRGCVARAVASAPDKVVVRYRPVEPRTMEGDARGANADAAGEAVRIARMECADAVCVVDVSDCGWRLMIAALPPVWTLENHLDYSLRVFDVGSGKLVMETNRKRRNGGVLATIVPRLLPQLESGVREDLRPWVGEEGT